MHDWKIFFIFSEATKFKMCLRILHFHMHTDSKLACLVLIWSLSVLCLVLQMSPNDECVVKFFLNIYQLQSFPLLTPRSSLLVDGGYFVTRCKAVVVVENLIIYSKLCCIYFPGPGFASRISLGSSFEGRPMYALRLTLNATAPVFFFNANIHAREWLSPATAQYIVNRLVEGWVTGVRRRLFSSPHRKSFFGWGESKKEKIRVHIYGRYYFDLNVSRRVIFFEHDTNVKKFHKGIVQSITFSKSIDKAHTQRNNNSRGLRQTHALSIAVKNPLRATQEGYPPCFEKSARGEKK